MEPSSTIQMPRIRWVSSRLIWHGVFWCLHNWAIRSLAYLTMFALLYLVIYLKDPEIATQLIHGSKIEVWCARAPESEPFTMTCLR